MTLINVSARNSEAWAESNGHGVLSLVAAQRYFVPLEIYLTVAGYLEMLHHSQCLAMLWSVGIAKPRAVKTN